MLYFFICTMYNFNYNLIKGENKMKKIRYYYSSMSKQVFLILLSLFVITRFIVFTEVILFDINDYSSMYNIGATMILYLCYLSICTFFFFGFKFFVTTYNDNQAIYHNKLFRQSITVDLTHIGRAVFNNRGIYLYCIGNIDHCFFIPFFRFGIISPVGVNDFYKLLKTKNIQIEKTFETLPGTGKSQKISSMIYSGLALLTLGSLTQSIALATAILKNH